jgi:6-phosphogluconolactonase
MPDMLYVGLQDDNRIAVFALDQDNGGLTKRADVIAAGGPSVMAISPDRNTLYVGHRARPSITSYRIDPATDGLSLLGTTAQADAPTFLAPDPTGRHMLCAYYQGGYVAVYPITADGTIGAAALDKQETAVGAHAIATDPSNRFAFVPHIARIQDNVLEPPKDNPGPNVILQYRFDAQTGRLSPNTPHRIEQGDLVGPATTSITRVSTLCISQTSRAAASPPTGSTARPAPSRPCRRPRLYPPVTVSAPPARRFT